MESHVLSRIFEFNGARLPDPDPKLSPEEVRNLYAHQYPDIARRQSQGRRRSETSCVISSRARSVQRGDPMSRNPKRKEVTKRAVLAELERLRQGRHARYQTLVGRFSRCREWQQTASLCAAAVNASARTNNRTPLDAPPGWFPPVS
jgi:PRTRC genetic system protein C